MMPCRYKTILLPRLILLMLLTMFASGCISDGECNCTAQTLIYICVAQGKDTSSGLESEKGIVDNALILIYNQNGQLQRTVKLTREEIENKTPVKIYSYDGKHPQVVVWGNLNGSEDLSAIAPGLQISDTRVSMQQKGGYSLSTDKLYYGFKELTDATRQNIEITGWTGSVYITVRGIENASNDADDYYFVIESKYNAYDSYGNPLEGNALLKVPAETGICQQEVVLIHRQVNLIGYPQDSDERQSMSVKLYKKTPEGDVLIASADKDSEGNSIMTHPGENTNILLDFTNKDNLNVYFKLTPWEIIHQWVWW